MDTLKQARREAVAAFMLVVFFVLAVACLSFADEHNGYRQHPQPVAHGTEASHGIDSIYALISSLVVGAGVLARELFAEKRHKKHEEASERIDLKFAKLFSYTDELKNKNEQMTGRMSVLETQVKGIEALQKEIKEVTQELKQIQLNIQRLIVIQEQYMKQRSGRDG